VPVSPPEALHLARLVSELPEPEQRAVRARFDAVASALDEHDLAGPLLRGDRQDAATMAPLTARYFGLALPCPFLADESCSIHAERPAGCREHLVTTPAARCAELGRSDVRVVPMPMPLSVPLARLAAERAGGAMRVIPLSLALRFAEQETELAERRWPGVDLLRRLLELTAQLRA
jgi:Fe-S-cluster containining protein